MRIARKVYMSIFTTMFILITCVATTFAWVGMFTTSTLGSFDLNLKVVKIDADYFLTISNSGIQGSFTDSINQIDLKRQILENMGKDTSLYEDSGIERLFAAQSSMEPVTTDKNLTNFYAIDDLKEGSPCLKPEKRFFKFDFYLTVDTKEGISGMSDAERNALTINANVFFKNIVDALESQENYGPLVNPSPFSTMPSNRGNYELLRNIKQGLTMYPKNATRIAFQTFDPIPIDSSYNNTESPNNTIIYQGGKQLPNVVNGIYDLGGILPEEYNLAIKEINKIFRVNIDVDNLCVDGENTPYLGAYDRINMNYILTDNNVVNDENYSNFYCLNITTKTAGVDYLVDDLIVGKVYVKKDNNYYVTTDNKYQLGTTYYSINSYIPSSYDESKNYYIDEYSSTDLEMVNENNKIWQSPNSISGTNYLGVQNGIQTKMKVSCYFWYEGFDADCLALIDRIPTTLNILFETDTNEA